MTRALRVGVLLGGHLVEERLFRLTPELVPVTVGQSLRCTLSIPADGVPDVHVLFAPEGDRFVLRATAAMTGRLARGGTITDLAGRALGPELDAPAAPSGTARTIPLERGTHGKLHLGDATILFQELTAPPVAPRPQLPASVRGTLADRIDRRLALTVACSLLGHAALAAWAWITDPVRDPPALPDDLATYEPPEVVVVLAPDVPAPAPPDDTAGDDGPLAPAVPRPAVARPARPRVQTPRPLRMPEPTDPDRWAQIMAGNQPGPAGQRDVSRRRPGATLDQEIADIRDRDREVRVGGDPTTREEPIRRGDGPDGPELDDPRFEPGRPKEERPPVVRVTPVPQPRDPAPPTLTPAMVVARIVNQYMTGLQRCYVKHGLAIDPSLSAKVTVRFGVDETGATFDNRAAGANPGVDRCVQDQMTRWRFPVPKDRDGDPTDASFQVQLVLRPG